MNVITLDIESAWDSKEYTLSKMGAIEYSRDQRFHCQMVGLAMNGAAPVVHADTGNDEVKAALASLDAQHDMFCAHNGAGFDFVALHENFGFAPCWMIDTIYMMRWCGLSRISAESHAALTELLGNGHKEAGTVVSDGKTWPQDFSPQEQVFFKQYCADDVAQCQRNMMAMMPYMTNDALRFMALTARMATEPVFVLDEAMLDEYIRQLDAEAEDARRRIMEIFHFATLDEFFKAIRSADKFAEMLKSLGVEPPTKVSEKKTATAIAKLEAQLALPGSDPVVLQRQLVEVREQGVQTYAFSKSDLDFLELREHDDPRVRMLVETRLEFNSSILRSRAETLLKFARHHKPLPIMLSAFKAHTGRYSAGASEGKSDSTQVQNLSKRNPAHLVLRKAIQAPRGYKIVACDSSQIELRVNAWMAQQHDLLAHLRAGRDPYAELAAEFDRQYTATQIHDGAKSGDKHCKQLRNVAKTLLLACLAGSTQVLTDTGWKRMDTVSVNDKLWDGEQWVCHQGLIYNGWKKTVNLDGVSMTPDHLIFDGFSWSAAEELLRAPKYLSRALRFGVESLKMCAWWKIPERTASVKWSIKSAVRAVALYAGRVSTRCCNALSIAVRTVRSAMVPTCDRSNESILIPNREINLANLRLCGLFGVPGQLGQIILSVLWKSPVLAGVADMLFCSPILWQERRPGVTLAPNVKQRRPSRNFIGIMPIFVPIRRIVDGCSVVLTPASNGAITLNPGTGTITAAVEFKSSLNLRANFWHIWLHCLAGMTRCLRSIASTMLGIMRLGICDLFHAVKICRIGEVWEKLANVFGDSRMKMPRYAHVYDIMNCGKNNRFLIKTDSGCLLVHNCGYGTSSARFATTLLRQGMRLADSKEAHNEIATHYHTIYRANNAAIVYFWKRCNQVLKAMIAGYSGKFGGPDDDTFEYGMMRLGPLEREVASVKMPSGYILRYPNLRYNAEGEIVYDFKLGKNIVPRRMYGAKLDENCCQSLAFQALQYQACRMDETGIQLKCNIHDSWATVVPDVQVKETAERMLWHMRQVPPWMAGCPLDAEVEIGENFEVV